jgi:tetratricopeptide (TPR) repeat protein
VLEGRVRKAGDQVRITAQLIDGLSGQHVGAERYERPWQEIFALQNEIIEQIVVHLNAKVWQAELERVRRRPTDNPTAYEYWLRGAGYYNRFTKEANALTRQMAERAIALDPNYADAYVQLGVVLYNVGRVEEGVELIKKGMRLNPYYPDWYAFNLGAAYRLLGRYEEAIAAHRDALSRNPNLLLVRLGLAGIYSELGREEEARAEAAAVLKISPAFSLEKWRQLSALKDPAILERQIAALRTAGLK